MNCQRARLLRISRGFTLLELLVAAAVGAIVLLVINGTFFGALRLSSTTQKRITSELELQQALGLIRRDLAGVMLPSGVLSGQFQTKLASSLAQGTYGDQVGPDLYTNTGSIDGWNPFSEVQLVDYYLTPATDGSKARNLIRVVTRNLLPVQATTPDVQTLLTGVADATIDYYDGAEWTDDWDSTITATLPNAIRFQVVLANSTPNQSASAPIELVVPVVVRTTTGETQAAAEGT